MTDAPINHFWKLFADHYLSGPDIGEQQRDDMRRAYYSGADALYALLSVSSEEMPLSIAMEAHRLIQAELTAFHRELTALHRDGKSVH